MAARWADAQTRRAGVIFSLDNRPRSPIGADQGQLGAGNGQEDPFGTLLNSPWIGPSPTLETGLSDADILAVDNSLPKLHVSRPENTNYIDAMSSNTTGPVGDFRLLFSVDRASRGADGSGVQHQFLLNQQPGDIYESLQAFAHPSSLLGELPQNSGYVNRENPFPTASNRRVLDDSQLGLTAGMGIGQTIGPDDPAPPIEAGTHDSIDALDAFSLDGDNDRTTDVPMYYSVNPDQSELSPNQYASASAIHLLNPESQGPELFAPAPALGLDLQGPNTDDVDALILFDNGTVGVLDPGIDFALFSLSPGSQSLTSHQITAADLFFTDFKGSFTIFAPDETFGLDGTMKPAENSLHSDNLASTALILMGDMNQNHSYEYEDYGLFSVGLSDPEGYLRLPGIVWPAENYGDFEYDGDLDFDDIDEFSVFAEENLLLSPAVPEPAASPWIVYSLLCLTAIARRYGQSRTSWYQACGWSGQSGASFSARLPEFGGKGW